MVNYAVEKALSIIVESSPGPIMADSRRLAGVARYNNTTFLQRHAVKNAPQDL